MMIAYGDLISGISGDMVAGALLDLGLPLKKLKEELKKIPTLNYRLEVTKKSVRGIRATRFRVICGKGEPERSPPTTKKKALLSSPDWQRPRDESTASPLTKCISMKSAPQTLS
jgi:uncharacterized protein (DUF111 family)